MNEIKDLPIVDIIGRYLNLKKRGANFIALCPFHPDKSPSFTVSEKRKSWKCFGCDKGGDVLDFIQEFKGVDFKAALEILNVGQEPTIFIESKSLPPPKNLSFIPQEIMKQSLKAYEQNNFVMWLNSLFEKNLVEYLAKQFHIGTSKRWKGATVFWQVDNDLKVRQAKVMLYNPDTGRRLKENEEPDPGKAKIYFAGKSILKKAGITEPELKQCFFGEHQLSRKIEGQKVAIVESEKTAILMTAFGKLGLSLAEDFIWIATGGKNGIKWAAPEILNVLKGCKVALFPDLGAYEDWKSKSYQLTGCKVYVSETLTKYANDSDQKKGLDIADYFLRIYSNGLQEQTPVPSTQSKAQAIENPPPKFELPTILSKQEQILAKMIEQNSYVGNLVYKFKLVPYE